MNQQIIEQLTEVNRTRSAAAGLDPSQYAQVTDTLTDLAQWPAAFGRAAEEHLDLAHQAESQDRPVSAAQAYRDASRWFHFATCVPDADTPTVRDAETRAAAALRAALTLESPTGEVVGRIEALDSDTPFVALIQRPTAVTNPPVAIVIPGLDSSKEEFQTLAAGLRRRGLATVSIDGPGQGEAVGLAPPCPEYERVVAAVLDRLTDVSGLDLTRVGAVGLSLGGYYVARAAVHEPRLKAAVAVTGPYSLANWDTLPPPLQTTLTVRAAGHDPAAIAARIDLTGTAAGIRQPLLVVCGEADPVVDPADMHRLATEAPAGQLLSVPGGDHLCANTTWKWQPQAGDWLADQLQVLR